MSETFFHAPAAEADPATPEARRALAQRMILAAIGRYEATITLAWEADLAYPNLWRAELPRDPEGEADHRAWHRLVDQAQADFNAAELTLAETIQGFYDDLATEDRRIADQGEGAFVERGVRVGTTTYILNADVAFYEPGKNIIAIARGDQVIDIALPSPAPTDGSPGSTISG